MNEISESMRTGFWIAAGLLVVFSMFRGWREGPMRMLAGLGALAAAYAAGFFGGRALVPMLRAAFDLPDFALAVLGGAALALTVYGIASVMIAILLRRTGDQESGVVRLGYGVSGAAVGLVVGLTVVWIGLLGLRLVGTVAEARLKGERAFSRAEAVTSRPPNAAAPGAPPYAPSQPSKLALSVARLKASVDSGVTSAALDKVDVIPPQVYDTLGQVAQVVSNPAAAQRFLAFPGTEKLSRHPKLAELAKRQEISEALRRQAYIGLLHHPAVVDAANDPNLAAELRVFDLDAALKFALDESKTVSPANPGQP